MLCPSRIGVSYKVAISFLIGLLLLGGLAALIIRYFEVFSDLNRTVNKNPAQGQAVDLARLAETYQTESAGILSVFFAAYGNGADVPAAAKQAQQDLLALSLPAEYKQPHLQAILLLGEISDLAAAGDSSELAGKITELRGLFDSE